MKQGWIPLCLLLGIVGFAFVSLAEESENRASRAEKIAIQRDLPKIEGKGVENSPMASSKEIPEIPYTALVEKNIFSPERKEFPIFSTPEPVKKPPARPQVVLYGVTLAGDYQSASLVQPGRSLRKGEREMLTLRTGERIGEYRLAEIKPDRIVLEGEGDSFEVLLNDPSRPKQRTVVKTETKPATITSTLPGTPVGPGAEPPRPATGGTPTTPRPEVTRPTPPSPVHGMERVVPPTPVTPPSVTPPVPQAVAPGSVPAPTPSAPTSLPTPMPRRGGRVVPMTSGVPAPETPGQTQGQGSP